MPDALAGTLLTVLGLLLIGTLGVLAWCFTTGPCTERLGPDNCPLAGPLAVHLVIFDQSDPATPQQVQRIKHVMRRLKADARKGDRFDIYSFEGTAKDVLEPRLQMCRPPDKVNEWIQNAKAVRRRYEDFISKLDGIVDELLKASTKPNSPIIESLRAAAITSLGPLPAPKTVPIRVLLFSDMIQHSDLSSHYRSDADFAELAKGQVWPRLGADLKGAETEIFYLLRPEAKRGNGRPIQNRGHQLFWEHLIAAAGGHLTRIEAF